MSGDVVVICAGVCCMSVCVHIGTNREEVEAFANLHHPTGVSSRWQLSTDKKFADGQPVGCQCEEYMDRQHFLLNC